MTTTSLSGFYAYDISADWVNHEWVMTLSSPLKVTVWKPKYINNPLVNSGETYGLVAVIFDWSYRYSLLHSQFHSAGKKCNGTC